MEFMRGYTTVQKLLTVTLVLYSLVLFFMYIGWLLGYRGFLLVPRYGLPEAFIMAIEITVMQACFVLYSGVILKIYDKRLLRICLAYLPVNASFRFAYMFLDAPMFVGSTILPVAITLVFGWQILPWKELIKRTATYLVLLGTFQFITLTVRTGAFQLDYNLLPVKLGLILSVDLLICKLLIYLREGEKYEIRRVLPKWTHDNVVFPADIGGYEPSEADRETIAYVRSLVGWRCVVANVYLLAFQFVQWALILLICNLSNVFWEGVLISASFVAHGFIIKRKWHAKNVVVCTLSAAALFLFAARISPNSMYTQLVPLLMGLLLVYAMYKLSIHLSSYNSMKEYIAELSAFKLVKHCDYARLKEIAETKNLTSKELLILKLYYCENASWAKINAQLAPWSESTIRKFLKASAAKFNDTPAS